jgi:hypothetical protein
MMGVIGSLVLGMFASLVFCLSKVSLCAKNDYEANFGIMNIR